MFINTKHLIKKKIGQKKKLKIFFEILFFLKFSNRFFGTFPSEIVVSGLHRIFSPESHLSNETGLIEKFQPQAALELKAQNLLKISEISNFSSFGAPGGRRRRHPKFFL